MSSRHAQLALLSACLLLPACVVSTFEGPGEPPRVATSPALATSGRPVGGHDHDHTEHESQQPDGPVEIGARHVLVAYQGALRASPSVTRSKGEAEARANEALTRARAGENFEQLVKEFSDEPGAGERGGSLGRFQRGMMVKAFEKAAFKLAPGEVSGIVETQFGYHVIQRTE
jgi:peptidyl-prolyl cis-trans isomerase NIMA-interacting 1